MKKLIDLLFETEEVVEVEKPLTKVEPVVQPIKPITIEPLKPASKTTTITLDEPVKKPQKPRNLNSGNAYHSSTPISPIFGILNQENKPLDKSEVKEVKKPVANYDSGIISPIFGAINNETTTEVSRDHKIEVSDVDPLSESELDALFDINQQDDFLDSVIEKEDTIIEAIDVNKE